MAVPVDEGRAEGAFDHQKERDARLPSRDDALATSNVDRLHCVIDLLEDRRIEVLEEGPRCEEGETFCSRQVAYRRLALEADRTSPVTRSAELRGSVRCHGKPPCQRSSRKERTGGGCSGLLFARIAES